MTALTLLRALLLMGPMHFFVKHRDGVVYLDLRAIVAHYQSQSNSVWHVHEVYVEEKEDHCVLVRCDGTKLSTRTTDLSWAELRVWFFLTYVMLQQLQGSNYHNFVHFYYNDLVLWSVRNFFAETHWCRQLLRTFMRFQTAVNNAGMYAQVSTDFHSGKVEDEVYGVGTVLSWSEITFQKDVRDVSSAYYTRTARSPVSEQAAALQFSLRHIYDDGETEPSTATRKLYVRVNEHIRAFVDERVEHHYSHAQDAELVSLLVRSVRPHIAKESYAPTDDELQLFKLILTRYIFNAAFAHGFEHYMMNVGYAPLYLPQRVRSVYVPGKQIDDYSNARDKRNGFVGHLMFTKYVRNSDRLGNWASLHTELPEALLLQQQVLQELDIFRNSQYRELWEIYAASDIRMVDPDGYYDLLPDFIATSIAM